MAETNKAAGSYPLRVPGEDDVVCGLSGGFFSLFKAIDVAGMASAVALADNAVTFAKLADMNTARLIGRSTAGTGDPEEITIGSGLDLSAGVLSATIPPTSVADNSITPAKLEDIAEASFIGRNTSVGTGDPQVLSAAVARAILGISAVENTALSTWIGATTITTVGTIGSGQWNATPMATANIADDAVTYAKLQNVSTNARLLGRFTAGAGNVEEISLGTGLTLIAGVLDAPGGGSGSIADNAVTFAKLADMAPSTIIGRHTASSGDPEAISIGSGLTLSGGVLSAPGTGSGTFSIGGGSGSGPELAPSVTGGGYTLSGSTPPTQNGSGIHFVAASNLATASAAITALADNTTYDVSFTVANLTGGAVRVICYGDTNDHAGATSSVSANGTYNVQVTTGATGSFTNQVRIQATGTTGTNTFDITALSVKAAGVGTFPTRAMDQKVKEIQVSVIDFGADPTGTLDSTSAFNSAIAFGARRIYVPAGTYRVSSLTINRSIEIFGDGREFSVIQITGTGNIHGMRLIGESSLGRSNLIKLKDFQLNYVGSGQTVAGAGAGNNNWSGIYIQRKCIIESVYVRNFTNDGIYWAPSDADEATGNGGTIDNAVFFARLTDVWSKDNGRDGIAVRRGANANNFMMCQFDRNGRYGFHHYTDGFSTYGNIVRDGQCSYNEQYGYYFENGTNIVTEGLYAEYNGSPNHTNTDGYTNTPIDIYVGDNCVRSFIGIGVLLNASTTHVRLPAFNPATIQVWEGGRRLFGDT